MFAYTGRSCELEAGALATWTDQQVTLWIDAYQNVDLATLHLT